MSSRGGVGYTAGGMSSGLREMPAARRRWPVMALGAGLLFSAFLYFNNTDRFVTPRRQRPTLLAHRGIAQRFALTGVDNDTCTATRIAPPTTPYLENTIPSIAASFAAGADVVEIDVHPTTDGEFAVFHDWSLDCRTDGHGVTREHSMAQLRRLDAGYGYTADGGKTFPFRGKGLGLIPSLTEVLGTFPDHRFLINVKSNDPGEGLNLGAALGRLPQSRRALLMVYGGDRPVANLRRVVPGLEVMSRQSLTACLVRYMAYGWSGAVPALCANMVILVPNNVAPWLWGWPNRFLARMDDAHSPVFLLGPYHRGSFSSGIDTTEALGKLPRGYWGGVWTDEIETIARAVVGAPSSP
jgi:glycerophosphoryl diester phosphodiesterase